MTTLDDLRSRGLLQEVRADRTAIDRLMNDARRHLHTAALALESEDQAAAYQIAYDAPARRSPRCSCHVDSVHEELGPM